MDLSHAAFGLDMKGASRLYFTGPVLNPQVQAQAVGRVQRISQQMPVTVETLVLKNSIEEVILERNEHMTQAEHTQTKSILDISAIYNWIKNPKIIPLASAVEDIRSQMTPLETPQYVFGKVLKKDVHPDDGIILEDPTAVREGGLARPLAGSSDGLKRTYELGPGDNQEESHWVSAPQSVSPVGPPPTRKVRFTVD